MKETKRKHLMLEVKHFNVQGKFGIFPIRSDFSENGEIFPVGSFPIGNKHCFITKGNVLKCKQNHEVMETKVLLRATLVD